jgi:hypothetical protein
MVTANACCPTLLAHSLHLHACHMARLPRPQMEAQASLQITATPAEAHTHRICCSRAHVMMWHQAGTKLPLW